MHPSFPLVGEFTDRINLLQGLEIAHVPRRLRSDPGVHLRDHVGPARRRRGGYPGLGGGRVRAHHAVRSFGGIRRDAGRHAVGRQRGHARRLGRSGAQLHPERFGTGSRFAVGVAIAIRMMFRPAAQRVMIPTNENVLGLEDFDPMVRLVLTVPDQADLVERKIRFLPESARS